MDNNEKINGCITDYYCRYVNYLDRTNNCKYFKKCTTNDCYFIKNYPEINNCCQNKLAVYDSLINEIRDFFTIYEANFNSKIDNISEYLLKILSKK